MDYYSTLKRNELLSHKKTSRNLNACDQIKKCQSENATYSMIPTISHSGKGKTMETVKRAVVARG